jgi:acetylornithine deacetylase
MTASASTTLARLREAFDARHALALLRRAIATPSVTGQEAAFAALLRDELVAIGAEGVASRDFAPGRPNVWGLRKGRPGANASLMIGHTGAVHVRGRRERWAGTAGAVT